MRQNEYLWSKELSKAFEDVVGKGEKRYFPKTCTADTKSWKQSMWEN